MISTQNVLSSSNKLHRKQRYIIRRLIVRGILVLDTPTCLGSGDTESPTDLPLLRDSISECALLTGASIAGALRNYLHEFERGYREDEQTTELSTVLFGGTRQDDDGDQSPLIVNDAISTQPIQAELRDGVKIDSDTGTAAEKAKYDLELLQAGTEFPLCFELLIEKDSNEAELLKGLAIALSGLEKGEISLGMKKRRGFGRCHVKEWQVWNFNLDDVDERMTWLKFEHWRTGILPNYYSYSSFEKAFAKIGINLSVNEENDKRDRFTINATFTLASPLLIRSGQAETGRAPDVVHLKSKRNGELKPIISGTSLAGVLRHRAERIVNTLKKPTTIIDEIFGPDFSKDKTKQAKASRLIVHESVIKDTTDLVQTRIAIDRFTGGAYHGALFQEQPIFASDKTELELKIELRNPEEYEIGLLLLLLKDLWTEDLPVGGGSSVGRGRLKGKKATMTRKDSRWEIEQNSDGSLKITPEIEILELYVETLKDYVSELVKCVEESNK